MKKIYIALQLIMLSGTASYAQNLYSLNKTTWINLDNFEKADSADAPEKDFKLTSKYANRFHVFSLSGEIPTSVVYKDRPFRVVDESHIGYKVSAGSREIKVETKTEDETLDQVAGNQILLGLPDGIVYIQRLEGEGGYKVSRYDDWARVKYKQNVPHTNVIEKNGMEFKVPYLFYFMHTDRFLVFNTPTSKDVRKTVVMDLKDGKMLPIESNICGAIRAENDIAIKGYILREDERKAIKVSMPGANWALKENNITKVTVETLLTDSIMVMARHYKGAAGISLAALNAKTGKVVWVGEVKQPTAAPTNIYLSLYKNTLLMEGVQPGGNYLEAFDVATGKRTYSTL